MKLTFLRRAWPFVRWFGRQPVARTRYRRLPDGTLRTLPGGQVRLLPE